MTIEKIRLADANDQYDVSALVPVAPIDTDAMLNAVRELLSSIADPDYRRVSLELLYGERRV